MRLPPCPIDKVAPTLSLQMYGGCADGTVNQVLQAAAGMGNGWLLPETENAASRTYAGRADYYEGSSGHSHAGYVSAGEHGAPLISPENSASEKEWWNPEKWMPDVFRNV